MTVCGAPVVDTCLKPNQKQPVQTEIQQKYVTLYEFWTKLDIFGQSWTKLDIF